MDDPQYGVVSTRGGGRYEGLVSLLWRNGQQTIRVRSESGTRYVPLREVRAVLFDGTPTVVSDPDRREGNADAARTS